MTNPSSLSKSWRYNANITTVSCKYRLRQYVIIGNALFDSDIGYACKKDMFLGDDGSKKNRTSQLRVRKATLCSIGNI